MKRKFVETEIFQEDLLDYKIRPEMLLALQSELLENPEKGALVPGTGGTRKVRMAKATGGKSGGFRVLYTDFKSSGVIYFWMILDKADQANLTSEQQNILKYFNQEISKELKEK
jgi:hypothetical protein